MKTLDKIVIIICIIAILGLLGSCDLKHTEINPVFKITKADDTEDEMNAWCDNSPECYDQLMQENELVKGLHFGQNLIEQIIYRFPPYNEPLTIFRKLLTYHAPDQEPIVQYLWQISHDKDFLYTVRAENGILDPFRQSILIGKNGYRDQGLCQLNRQYHSDFIDSKDFQDWKKQADYCWQVYQERPTAFYGYYQRHKEIKYFSL